MQGAHILELDEAPCQHARSPRHWEVQLQVICGRTQHNTSSQFSQLITLHRFQ